ncbi:MAG: cell envelope integrity protein TolA [Clostridia bacterium]|nr:cell envelope integrity protein TolA [Clostridia bacterium]
MSKKTKVVTTIIALCLGLVLVGTKAYATTGKAINDTTRIRKKANTTSEVVAVMTKGEKIEILSEEDGWYKVKYKESDNTITGYVRNDLLDVEGEKKQEEQETKNDEKKETQTEEKEAEKEETEQKQEETISNNEETKVKETAELENTATEDQKAEQESEQGTEQEMQEVEKEEVVFKENEKLQLKSETDVQLLPLIFSCKTGKISANTQVIVLEVVGNWTKIESEDQEGWIPTIKLEKNQDQSKQETKTEEKKEENNEEKTENKTTKMYVNTITLNLREKADTGSKVVTQLNQNDEVTIVKVVDSTWSQVKAKGYEGYTASEYLSEKKASDKTSRGSDDIRKEAEAQKKAEQEAKKKAEEEAKKKAEEEAKKKAEAEAKKKAEEEAKKKAEAEAKKKAEEEAKKKAEAEAKKKAEQEAKKKAEAEAKKKESKKETSSSKTTSSSKKSGTTGEDIVAYAKKFLGCKYVYGTAGPNTFDCSGLTSYVYKHFGYSLNRTSGGQRSNGTKVNKSDLQPGDILCFSGHVGIYIGGNKFIHAANPRRGVIITSLSESYYVKTYITARRIL